MKDTVYQGLLEGSLISNLEKWIQYLDSSRRFGTPISEHGINELKTLLEQALERIENVSSSC